MIIMIYPSILHQYIEEEKKRYMLDGLVIKDVSNDEIINTKLTCNKYKTNGEFKIINNECVVVFEYEKNQYGIPFNATFTKEFMPFLKSMAEMLMEMVIDNNIVEGKLDKL